MLKKYLKFLSIFTLALGLFSCSDDVNYIAITIEANSDSIAVSQNSSITIDVLANDINVPSSGLLNTITSQNGTAQVLDPNSTPNDPSDDVIRYTPNNDFVGSDSFQYII
jgi:hypothetical protein